MFSVYFFHRISVIIILISVPGYYATLPLNGNETDHQVLLDFKNRIIQDPLQILSSWNGSVHYCNWTGITCNRFNTRVTILNLSSQKLVGSLPFSIGNLTFLTGLNLVQNGFHGEIPQEIGFLSGLKHLNLRSNSFSGRIPSNLCNCTELTFLGLEYNQLDGKIPENLSSLSKLQYMGVSVNKLSGGFPAWIGNLSSAFFGVSLAHNGFRGSIPSEIDRLTGLEILQIYGNQFSGEIPPSVYNTSSMRIFTFAQNQLHGQFPPDLGLRFPNLEIFAGGVNNFTGSIPVSLSNASRLQVLDFPDNSLKGTVPDVLGSLSELYRLNFDSNNLGTGEIDTGDLSFFSSLANCSNLRVLSLVENFFSGELPNSLVNLSTTLEFLSLGGNRMHGNLPHGMGKLVNLTTLALEGNYFTGTVPDDFGGLPNLRQLHLEGNRLSGMVPSSLGNLTSLFKLFLERNEFEGIVPSEFGNLRILIELDISDNKFTGAIPKEIMSLASLSVGLFLARNSLIGPLPPEVGQLVNLRELDISENKLSGAIPSSIGSCIRLERLIMRRNLLEGGIPKSLQSLRGLRDFDLSHNKFSGEIPKFLGQLPFLEKLNLSFNSFEGELANEGILSNTSVISVEGNDRLCGGAPSLHLPTCSNPATKLSDRNLKLRVFIALTVSVTIIFVLLCSVTACYIIKKRKQQQNVTVSGLDEYHRNISYSEIYHSTNGFSADNLIGSGSFGSVYRGILGEMTVAVKVLNLDQKGATKSFADECRTLKNVRHRNLLKIITVCSSLDFQGKDFKCLVFELMSNGSLDEWLHPRMDTRNRIRCLDFLERLNIAIDVASALDYLHNYCHTPIVHCDLKPSNILLDKDLTALVGDFGLATFLFDASKSVSCNHNPSVELKGSIGYIPPEYGSGSQASTLGDVYSYGILLLEIFTGKRPTDDMFKDGLSIHYFVAMALPHNITQVVDTPLLFEEEQDRKNVDESEENAIMKSDFQSDVSTQMEFIVSVMNIGISCSMPLPRDRMTISVAVSKLIAIRDLFLKIKKR